MPDARCSIDTSSLIHGWREVYFPENFEGFWQKLGELADNGVLVASKEVLREIKRERRRSIRMVPRLRKHVSLAR